MQTRNQKLAADVFQRVETVKNQYPNETAKERTEYGSMAHKLPVLIRTAGLAQALGFVEARGSAMHKELLKNLAETLGVLRGSNVTKQLLLKMSRGEEPHDGLEQYLRLTQDSLAALLWYKRFAQSVLKVEADEGDKLDVD